MVQAGLGAKDLTLHVQERPDAPQVYGNGRLIRQAILNLLQNAIKFTPPGGNIWLECAGESDDLCISVRDDGIGMEQGTFCPSGDGRDRAHNQGDGRLGGRLGEYDRPDARRDVGGRYDDNRDPNRQRRSHQAGPQRSARPNPPSQRQGRLSTSQLPEQQRRRLSLQTKFLAVYVKPLEGLP